MPFRSLWLQPFTLGLASWLVLVLCITDCTAQAQAPGTPSRNASRSRAPWPPENNSRGGRETNRETHYRDPLGNLCLQVQSLARPHVANPNIYDHVLIIDNRCL